ncbi:MAG: hypothetical protein KJP07_10750, partial [Desulfatitalea sp.]|nr:hypothetical protein [Desulfatitalea sp.]
LYRVWGYFSWVNPFGAEHAAFVSCDAIYQDYDAEVFGKDHAMNYSFSAGMHLFDERMELRLTGLYSQDPYFDENIEGLFSCIYRY